MIVYSNFNNTNLIKNIIFSDILNEKIPELSLNLMVMEDYSFKISSEILHLNDFNKNYLKPNKNIHSYKKTIFDVQKNSLLFNNINEEEKEKENCSNSLDNSFNSINISNGNIKLTEHPNSKFIFNNKINPSNIYMKGNKNEEEKKNNNNNKELNNEKINKLMKELNDDTFQNKSILITLSPNNIITVNTTPLKSKYYSMPLNEITNHLFTIAKKQTGCRYLQKLISISKKEDLVNKSFYPKLYPTKLLELCNDLFGNYLVQKMIPYLNFDNLFSLTNLVIKNLEKLCLNPHGTRVVQILINQIKNCNNLLNLFTNSLIPLMPKLIKDLNGSFVLITYALEIPFPKNNIIYTFLNNNIIEICSNSYSCSALQKCIDIGNQIQKKSLLNNISSKSMYLILNQYGNYVIQFIIMKNDITINDKIFEGFINNISFLAKQKYSSNVIEKCFDYCSENMKKKIIQKISDKKTIKDLLKDMYGNYVLQKILTIIHDEKIKNYFLNVIGSEINNLNNYSFGKKLSKKLIFNFPDIKKYINNNKNKKINSNNSNINNINNNKKYEILENNMNNPFINNNNISNNYCNLDNYISSYYNSLFFLNQNITNNNNF